jgi:hypothetical protein
MEGCSFSGASERREKFLYLGIYLWGIWQICKKRPRKRAALSVGALLGNLEGVHLLGLLRAKDNAYLGSFFLDPEDVKSYVWERSGTLARNRAPLSWYQIMGHKGPVYKAQVHWDHKGSSPNTNQSVKQIQFLLSWSQPRKQPAMTWSVTRHNLHETFLTEIWDSHSNDDAFCNIMLCNLVEVTDISEEYSVSIKIKLPWQ